jgi:hypothetical protein
MNILQNCESQFLELAAGSTKTNQLSAGAAEVVERYWPELTAEQQNRLQHWLAAVHTGARRLMAPAKLKERSRRAEVAMGAINAIAAIERKAPPERG